MFTDLILTVEVSSSLVTISPNDQFPVTCTARAEVDGQGLPARILMAWSRIAKSASGLLSFLIPLSIILQQLALLRVAIRVF